MKVIDLSCLFPKVRVCQISMEVHPSWWRHLHVTKEGIAQYRTRGCRDVVFIVSHMCLVWFTVNFLLWIIYPSVPPYRPFLPPKCLIRSSLCWRSRLKTWRTPPPGWLLLWKKKCFRRLSWRKIRVLDNVHCRPDSTFSRIYKTWLVSDAGWSSGVNCGGWLPPTREILATLGNFSSLIDLNNDPTKKLNFLKIQIKVMSYPDAKRIFFRGGRRPQELLLTGQFFA